VKGQNRCLSRKSYSLSKSENISGVKQKKCTLGETLLS